jgi:hypothetical protein
LSLASMKLKTKGEMGQIFWFWRAGEQIIVDC